MTVGELIKWLEEFPSNGEILIAGDPEGNYFRKLDGLGTSLFKETRGHIEVYNEDEVEIEDLPSFNKCLVIWP